MRSPGRLLIAVGILAMLVAAAGCAPQAQPSEPAPSKPATPAPAPAPAPAAPSGPKTGGTVTIGLWSEPSNLLPHIWPTAYDRYVQDVMYDKLVRANERFEWVPALAEKWEFSPDGCTITFTLREGAQWHDGTPLTAEDVEFTYTMLAHPQYDGGSYSKVEGIVGAKEFRAGEADSVSGIKVIDARTIAFTTPKPSATIMTTFGDLLIIPKHLLADVPCDQWKTSAFNTESPLGSGLFKFVQYETGRFVEFEANDAYFNGRPNIDKLIMRIGDQNAMLAAFINKEVDVIRMPLAELEAVEDLPFAELAVYDSTVYQYVGMNTQAPGLNDPAVRRAMAHAFNKEQIVKSLLRGYARLIDAPVAPIMWAYPDNPPAYDFNPQAARELLESAGWTVDEKTRIRTKDGVALEFELIYPTGNLVRMQFPPILQQNLEAIGIKIELRAMDFPTMVGHLLPRDAQGKLRAVRPDDFQIYVLGFSFANGDPDTLFSYFHSAYMPPNGYNFVGVNDPRIDELWEQSRLAVDFEQRKDMIHEIMNTLARDVPWIPLYAEQEIWVANERLNEFAPGPHGLTVNIIDWWVD